MKTLYLDCGMGAAGDMLASALLELFPDPRTMVDELNAVGIPGVEYCLEPAEKCGIKGSRLHVLVHGEEEHEAHHTHDHEHEHHHEHHHSGLGQIEHIISSHLTLPDEVRQDALDVFRLLAEAESHVHGVPVTNIHFHEVGTMDAVADIVAFCYLLYALNVDKVSASPVCTGGGYVHCAHGVLPVPAPATAYLLRDLPIYGGEIQDELCTPTGAALLKRFCSDFGEMPLMRASAIGYGMGKKDFPRANCVRAILGEASDETDSVAVLSCNIDDMTGEALGYAAEKLRQCGALDVTLIPILMKKNRPGTCIEVLCRVSDKDSMIRNIFRYTTTLGVRESIMKRYTLSRETDTVDTEYGSIRFKVSDGYGVRRDKPEADDVARVADERGCSFMEAQKLIEEA